jgi:hypothetical protein
MENPGEGREHTGYVPDVLTAQPKSYVAHRRDVLIYDNPMVHPVLRARIAKMSGSPVFSMAWVEIATSKELRHQARSIRPVRSQEGASLRARGLAPLSNLPYGFCLTNLTGPGQHLIEVSL